MNCKLTNSEIAIYQQNIPSASIALAPMVNGEQLAPVSIVPTGEDKWRIDCKSVVYTVEAGRGMLTYGIDSCHIGAPIDLQVNMTVNADRWRTFVSDEWDREISSREDHCVWMSSSDLRDELPVETWMMSPQPHCCALHVPGGNWLGVSAPGPKSVGKLSFRLHENSLQIGFHKVFPGEFGLPEICVIPGLQTAEDVLSAHTDIARKRGFVNDEKPVLDWWSRPMFCSWGTQFMSKDTVAEQLRCLDENHLMEWVSQLEERTGNRDFTVVIDIGWYEKSGDFKADQERFPNMRDLVDRLKSSGHRVLLWMSPFFAAMDSQWAMHNPETLVTDKDGNPAVVYSFWTEEGNHYLKDFSVPRTREMTSEIIRHCISSEKGCLNADGFKLDFNYQTPNPDLHAIRYPEWGIGDAMYYKVLRLFHETVHAIKPDALLSASGNEPYMQPYTDVLRLNDHFGGTMTEWCKRAHIAGFTLPRTLIDMDGWALDRHKACDYRVKAPVAGIPSIHHMIEFDDLSLLNPAEESVPRADRLMRAEDWRRLAVTCHLYSMAPHSASQKVVVNPGTNELYRLHTDGNLAGFYSAMFLSPACLAVFLDERAYICAVQDTSAQLPLPPGAIVRAVESVCLDDSTRIPVEFTVSDGKATILVEDCGKRAHYVQVSYI